ncbi:MAG: peptidylprolyl isomerase [Micropepsaceae bacterium]
MKSLLKFAAAALVLSLAPAPVSAADSVQRAAAIVNGVVISTYDLDQRVRMVLATSGGGQNAAAQQRIRESVLRTLIDEILQLKEAERVKLKISEKDIDEAIDRIGEQNNTSRDAIMKSLAANNVDPQTFRTQIMAELAWTQILEGALAPRVRITDEDVDAEMKRIEEGASKPQYLASEIFISIDSDQDEPRARRMIQQIYQQLQTGTSFPQLAQQFSESSSGARGGDLGWVQDADVAPEVWATVQKMRLQTVSPPIRTNAGYYLIALRDKMRPAGSANEAPPVPPGRPAGVPAGSVKLKRIVLGVPPQMSKADEQNYVGSAMQLRELIRGCQGLEEFLKPIRGVALVDLPVLPVKDPAPEIQQIVRGLNPSDVSHPYFSVEGEQRLMNMLVVCGDRIREDFIPSRVFEMPSREQVETRMFNAELSVLARRYMRDLRRDAAIEIRDLSVLNTASN